MKPHRLIIALICFAFCGCAAQHKVMHRDPERKFWQSCSEVIPSVADGFQHFSCTDIAGKQWDIRVRRKPK